MVAYGAWAEAEDVLTDTTPVDLVHLTVPIQDPRIRLRRTLGRNLRRVAGPTARLPGISPLTNPARNLHGRYDAIVFLAFSIWDLPLVERLGSLRRYTDCVVVWFIETWPAAFVGDRMDSEPFNVVDKVFVALQDTVDPIAKIIGPRVSYLPMGTDAIRFGPDSPSAERPIDLVGIGRRIPDQHDTMLAWAAKRKRFYIYDSTNLDRPKDDRRHRDNIGRWYASSKLAVTNYAKHDRPDLIQGLRIIPGRLWEGLASGAALIGIPPEESRQRALLGRTVVHPVPDSSGDLPEFLDETLERHGQAETNANIRLALQGHDWAHRWQQLFHSLDLAAPPGIERRIAELARRSEKFPEFNPT